MQGTLFDATMRWKGGRHVFVAGEVPFSAERYRVEPVTAAEATRFVREHHYARSYPAAILAVGLMDTMAQSGDRLCGVAVFSVPIQPRAAAAHGAGSVKFCDLGRLVILDEVPSNAETFFLRRALRVLGRVKTNADGRPLHEVVLAYSDPVPRTTADGRVVMPGHVGHIYGPAGSALYLGRATPRNLWLAHDASVLSERSLSKLRNGEAGARSTYERLVAFGAPPITPGEGDAAYVRRALADGPFRRMRHPGNHVYSFACGSHTARRRLVATMSSSRRLEYPRRDSEPECVRHDAMREMREAV